MKNPPRSTSLVEKTMVVVFTLNGGSELEFGEMGWRFLLPLTSKSETMKDG
ncbi:unnamed protein product [Dovyalis caffra]|uniref:Uncharacterized protein n=1 Tax=Dovyalis caffra TaxID=77055 RepID=A0AAV1SV00_9ROSI|nr:unnamed protein product [Dovyalis caffra]